VPRLVVLVSLALALGCRSKPPARPAPTTGAVAGVVRDRVTGHPIEARLAVHGDDSLEAHGVRSAADGTYRIEDLAPGTYGLVVELPGTSLQFTDIPVIAGRTTGFDIPVDSAEVEVPPRSYLAIETDDIQVFQPGNLSPEVGRLRGVVTDVVTGERAGGVVVTATSPSSAEVLTGVSDDAGQFDLAEVEPGTYELSAFYNVARRGQIEVKRSGVDVPGGSDVYVPMYVELSGQE
jgi:hypothetical protein